jgi:hypothetical protein
LANLIFELEIAGTFLGYEKHVAEQEQASLLALQPLKTMKMNN